MIHNSRNHVCCFHSHNLVNKTLTLSLELDLAPFSYCALLWSLICQLQELPSGDIQNLMKTTTIISNLVIDRLIRVCSSLKIKSDYKQEEQITLLGNVYPNCFACCAEFGMDGKFANFKLAAPTKNQFLSILNFNNYCYSLSLVTLSS